MQQNENRNENNIQAGVCDAVDNDDSGDDKLKCNKKRAETRHFGACFGK